VTTGLEPDGQSAWLGAHGHRAFVGRVSAVSRSGAPHGHVGSPQSSRRTASGLPKPAVRNRTAASGGRAGRIANEWASASASVVGPPHGRLVASGPGPGGRQRSLQRFRSRSANHESSTRWLVPPKRSRNPSIRSLGPPKRFSSMAIRPAGGLDRCKHGSTQPRKARSRAGDRRVGGPGDAKPSRCDAAGRDSVRLCRWRARCAASLLKGWQL